jgi:hypothetical protein
MLLAGRQQHQGTLWLPFIFLSIFFVIVCLTFLPTLF